MSTMPYVRCGRCQGVMSFMGPPVAFVARSVEGVYACPATNGARYTQTHEVAIRRLYCGGCGHTVDVQEDPN